MMTHLFLSIKSLPKKEANALKVRIGHHFYMQIIAIFFFFNVIQK